MQTNVWYEKYRPQKVDDVILPEAVKYKIKNYIKDGGFEMPHLGLFSRNPGTGKSSLAKAILKETEAEALFINASLDKGIDVLRTKIQRFSANKPLRDAVKIVVMDEFDHFSKDGQAAFRGFIDEFGKNVRFIFTGNYKENIIEPLLDRLEIYDFNQFDMREMAKPIYERLVSILEAENIEYTKEDVIAVIKQEYPRIRKMIGILGQSVQDGKLVVRSTSKEDVEALKQDILSKDYKAIQRVYGMQGVDGLYSALAQDIEFLPADKRLNALIILARYQHMHTSAKDKHLNVAGAIAELMKL